MSERGRTVEPPAWWLDMVQARMRDAQRDTTLADLGGQLAAAIGREEPWSHASLSRFLRDGLCTDELHDACTVHFHAAPAFFVARSAEESAAMVQLQGAPVALRLRALEQAVQRLQADVAELRRGRP